MRRIAVLQLFCHFFYFFVKNIGRKFGGLKYLLYFCNAIRERKQLQDVQLSWFRASALQAEGRRFESVNAHKKMTNLISQSFFVYIPFFSAYRSFRAYRSFCRLKNSDSSFIPSPTNSRPNQVNYSVIIRHLRVRNYAIIVRLLCVYCACIVRVLCVYCA